VALASGASSFWIVEQTPVVETHHVAPVHAPDMMRQSAQQALPQRAYPLAQATPQARPSQVAVPLAGDAGQGVHDDPQLASEVSDRHWLPQM
jgi:hypothetical protein